MIYPNSKMFFPIYKNNSGPQPGPEYSTMPLTFESTGNTAVQINKTNLFYNKKTANGQETGWQSYNFDYINLNNGETVSFSGTNEVVSTWFATSGTGTLEVYGNPHSLINNGPLTSGCFKQLFNGCQNIVDASNIILSASTLAPSCYYYMFASCSNLTGAPNLSATTLADWCYYMMFYSCALTAAPLLPATTLANYCYRNMFDGCKSLVSIPILSATTLAQGCYGMMFNDCYKLPSARIEAINVNYIQSLFRMFDTCVKLSSIEVNFTLWPTAHEATSMWLYRVAEDGTFKKPSELLSYTGEGYIPTGWQIVDK